MKNLYFFFLVTICSFPLHSSAQDCESKVIMILHNSSTGAKFAGQKVTLTALSDSKVYEQMSDNTGQVTFMLPCDQRFDVVISNYTSQDQIKSPSSARSSSTRNYTYAADMVEKQKAFAMNEAEKQLVDKAISPLPDTTRLASSIMRAPRDIDNYATMDITLIGLDSKPLVSEEIIFSGTARNKSFKGKTNSSGNLRVYLPKGDVYRISFKYHDDFKLQEIDYSKGTSTAGIRIQYMGTVEYLRRKKIEDERLIEERKQVIAALAQLENEFSSDSIVSKVLDRNKWVNKLFISDVSYEMFPFAHKLALWYDANRESETSTQFVFFYNGVLRNGGKSSSAFHHTAQGFDPLMALITKVHSKVGLENATHDIEGLINSSGIKNDYKDVVLLVDKDAPLADFEYFVKLKIPVHIILCVQNRRVNTQHLKIAWKTKGSFHTLTEDITSIGKLREGDSITIEGVKYTIMGGEFVAM